MKKSLLTVFAIIFVTFAFAQQNRCSRPLSSAEFNQRKQLLTGNNEGRKLQAAIRLSQESCLTTNQIKEIAMLFNDEYSRLDYTEKAYATVFDPENYYEVYDVFTKFSMAIRLYDFLNGKNSSSPITPNNPVNPTNPVNGEYPNYNYPDFASYSGPKNCGYPISDGTFEASLRGIKIQNETTKLNSLRQFVQNNCLSTSQVMKVASLLTVETNRLDILRTAFEHVYDANNYSSASQVLQNRANQEQFTAFLNGTGSSNPVNPTNPTTCKVEDAEFNNLLFTIRRETGTFSKFNITKNITKNYNCFSIEQVRTIVKEFSIESYKLDMAKYLYDYTAPAERRQYFMVGNEFSQSSSRTNLSNFLATKGN
ncbi:MAG: DUF4476 domain-containing protein [Raineya sp.]|jgi:hypothetical protein|nr:DUF4476 domain-containing protein [Raineya sp.]